MNRNHTDPLGSAKRAFYAEVRRIYTASKLLKTAKPRKKKVKPKEVEQLKNRVESVEGSEVVETIINVAGEQAIRPRSEKDIIATFNGA